jgi:hypothetical protein
VIILVDCILFLNSDFSLLWVMYFVNYCQVVCYVFPLLFGTDFSWGISFAHVRVMSDVRRHFVSVYLLCIFVSQGTF